MKYEFCVSAVQEWPAADRPERSGGPSEQRALEHSDPAGDTPNLKLKINKRHHISTGSLDRQPNHQGQAK